MSKPIPLGPTSPLDQKSVPHILFYFSTGVDPEKNTVTDISSMRIKIVYRASNWLFFDEFQLMIADKIRDIAKGTGDTFKITNIEPNRDVLGSSVITEIADLIVNKEGLIFIKKIIDNPQMKMKYRFSSSTKNSLTDGFVPSGTKKAKMHIGRLVEVYNSYTKMYSLPNQFESLK
jgi:hypothetical protein